MIWVKKGIVYSPISSVPWMQKYGMAPTPIYIPSLEAIRVFMGVTDIGNFGQTSYVDVKATEPTNILYIETSNPVLDFGNPGTFDDCGAIPSCCIFLNGKYHLYYIGFQRCTKVPFMLFPGLALSDDGKEFHRYSMAPIIDRARNSYLSFAAPCVIFDDNIYKMWLWIGNSWIKIEDKYFLSATIGYAESIDAISWKIISTNCITPESPLEFSIGRPWVVKANNIYKMYYSIRFKKEKYRLGYAESIDGIHWERRDKEIGLDVSADGWDSEMICYPSVITVHDKTYLFYNGNNNGETGFGVAELIEE
jgi:hypothetical protein